MPFAPRQRLDPLDDLGADLAAAMRRPRVHALHLADAVRVAAQRAAGDGRAIVARDEDGRCPASAICSTVMWKQNSGGVSASSVALSSAISARTSSCSGLSTAIVDRHRGYSTTFGTRKKFSSRRRRIGDDVGGLAAVGDDIRRASSSPSAMTEVIGSTPETSTSFSCSTKPRMAFSSPVMRSASSSLTAMRARCATRFTVGEIDGHVLPSRTAKTQCGRL